MCPTQIACRMGAVGSWRANAWLLVCRHWLFMRQPLLSHLPPAGQTRFNAGRFAVGHRVPSHAAPEDLRKLLTQLNRMTRTRCGTPRVRAGHRAARIRSAPKARHAFRSLARRLRRLARGPSRGRADEREVRHAPPARGIPCGARLPLGACAPRDLRSNLYRQSPSPSRAIEPPPRPVRTRRDAARRNAWCVTGPRRFESLRRRFAPRVGDRTVYGS